MKYLIPITFLILLFGCSEKNEAETETENIMTQIIRLNRDNMSYKVAGARADMKIIIRERGNKPSEVSLLELSDKTDKLTWDLVHKIENTTINPETIHEYISNMKRIISSYSDAYDRVVLSDSPLRFYSAKLDYSSPLIKAQLAHDIFKLELRTLEFLSESIGASDFKFDKVDIYVSPESKTVKNGETYRAKVILAATCSTINGKISIKGAKAKIEDVDNYHIIELPANHEGEFKNGKVEKSIDINYTFKGPNGDVTIPHVHTYTIVE